MTVARDRFEPRMLIGKKVNCIESFFNYSLSVINVLVICFSGAPFFVTSGICDGVELKTDLLTW